MTDDDRPPSRRKFLKLAGAGAVSLTALAGCSGTSNVKPGGDTLQYMAKQTDLPIVKGGPNDLQDSAKIKMIAMQGNEGHGYAYLPAVVWLKPGGTVKWAHEKTHGSKKVSHTVTAMNKGNDKPQYTPKGSAAFDSGILQMAFQSDNPQLKPGTNATALQGQMMNHRYGERPNMGNIQNSFQGPYKLGFKGPKFPKGVYMYMCEDHMKFGMVGSVIVGDVGPNDPGWSPGMTKMPMKKMWTDSFIQHFKTIRSHINSQVKS